MLDFTELMTGAALILISLGLVVILRQRGAKSNSWIKLPFVGPFLGVLITSGFGIGILFLVNYFTTIDDINMSGRVVGALTLSSHII